MSRRIVVNVATGPRYIRGQERLTEALATLGEDYLIWRDQMPPESPTHEDTPYAFKAYALAAATAKGGRLLLWADASIVPIRSLEPIWRHAEEHGCWFANNGWKNSQWTCDAAYPLLFPRLDYDRARGFNHQIPHVVATAFAIDMNHPNGSTFLQEYLRFAKNGAFRGPWWNSHGDRADYAGMRGAEPCGPPDCYGHRHDQTAASVIAWKLGIPLTQSPLFFTYAGQETVDTILVAKGI